MYDIQQIKNRISVLDYAQKIGLSVRKDGDRCVSPLRAYADNKTAFLIKSDYWYDFVSGEGGDVIDLCALVDFSGDRGLAIEKLAEMAGVPNDSKTPNYAAKWREQTQKRVSLIQGWHEDLRPQDREYLHSRRIADETINRLRIGFTGMGTEVEVNGEKKYNFAAGRICIPYYKNGYVVNYVARATEKDQKPKYLKLPINEYSENEPWGLHTLNRKQEVLYIAEGAFDALSLDQSGFSVLATMGGAFGKETLARVIAIAKNFKSVVLTFDNDEAGRKFTKTLGKILFDNDITISVADIPENYKDISDFYADNNEISDLTLTSWTEFSVALATDITDRPGVPLLRREELLSFATIAALLGATREEDEVYVIDELKRQAAENGVSKRDMNTLIAKVKKAQNNTPAPVPTLAQSALHPLLREGDFNNAGYEITEQGIYTYIGEHMLQVCPHPIFPIRIMEDLETGDEKIQIGFLRKGKWVDDIFVPRSLIAVGRNIVKLADRGVMVNDENARYIVKYLCDIEMANETLLKTTKSTATLGKTKAGWVPYCSDVAYDLSNGDNARRFALYKEHGSFEKWRDLHREICKHTIPKIIIAAGYASLLLTEFKLNPFGVHLWGETGKGKSVAIMASASIYGYPDIKDGIVYTGNSTANGLEPRLSFVRNYCFYLDELSLLSQKQIDDMIMLIMQGQGKMRMSKLGQARESFYWNCVSVSNSEMPIASDFAKGGVYNRIIQIKADSDMFGEMHLPTLADDLRENYGFGAKRFIDALNTPGCRELLPNVRRDFYNAVIAFTEDKQANAASLLLTAYEIARAAIYGADAPELKPEELIPFLASPDTISQAMRVYDKLMDYVDANYKMFDDSDIGFTGQKWGQFATHKDKQCVDIFPHRLDEFMTRVIQSMPTSQFVDSMKERGLLMTNDGRTKFSARFDGKIQRVYSFIRPVTSEMENCYQSSGNKTGNTLAQLTLIPTENEGDLPF